MEKLAQYIKSIEIDSLWSNRKHIYWELRPDVNILSGSNGVGKSTIINRSAAHLKVMRDGMVFVEYLSLELILLFLYLLHFYI